MQVIIRKTFIQKDKQYFPYMNELYETHNKSPLKGKSDFFLHNSLIEPLQV